MRRNAPSDLHPKARKLWYTVANEWSLDDAGFALLDVALLSLTRVYEAREAIKAEGLTYRTDTGYRRANPMVKIEHEAIKRFLYAWNELGLDWELEIIRPVGRPAGGNKWQNGFQNIERGTG